MDGKKTFLIAVAALALLVLFLGRYELIAVPAGGEGVHGTAYRLDRWTGKVTFYQYEVAGRSEIK